MVIKRGEVWWADLGPPRGSAPAYRRPIIIISDDEYNTSRIKTVIVMAVTSNLELAQMPGNVALPRWASGLPDVSIANVTQVLTLDRKYLLQHVKMLPAELIDEIDFGLRTSLGLP